MTPEINNDLIEVAKKITDGLYAMGHRVHVGDAGCFNHSTGSSNGQPTSKLWIGTKEATVLDAMHLIGRLHAAIINM